MPLARILTRFPEHAGNLSDELRRRGYTIEFSSPELAGKAPADLEIDFEICPEPDALSRASELAEQLHADVAVSPDVVQYVEPRTTEPIADAAGESLPVAEASSAEWWHGITAAEEPVRPADLDIAESAEPVPIEPTLATDNWQEFAAESEQHHSQNVPPAETAFDDELQIARAARENDVAEQAAAHAVPPQSGTASEKVSDIAARAGERSAAMLQAAGTAVGAVWASARQWAEEFWASARQRSQEYSERFEVRKAEMRAERQQKLLELEKRRALAQERAAELEAAREAAAARLQQLLRERGALTEAQPAPPQKIAAVPAQPPARAGLFSREFFTRKIRIPLMPSYRPQVEAVLVGVAAACLLFVVGVAVASFHTRPAISNSLNQPATSTSNGVTVQGGSSGVTIKAGNPGVTLTPSAATRPTAVSQTQSAAKPSAAVRHQSGPSDVTVRNFPSSPRTSGANRVSDDVTIRHFGGATNPPAQTSPRAELKHYSDLDN